MDMNRIHMLMTAALLALVAGCFPIELDVTPQGGLVISRQEGWFLFDPATNAVRKLRDPDHNRPVFARVSPDGQQLLTFAEIEGGQSDYDVVIGPLGGGPAKSLLRVRNPTYALWSPDGKQVAFTRMTTTPHDPDQPEESLELALLSPTGGQVRVLAQQVGPLFRWLPGGRQILFVTNPRGSDATLVDLMRVDVESGEGEPIAKLMAGDDYHLDVSRDGRAAAVCALDVAAIDQEVTRGETPLPRVFELDLKTLAIRKLGPNGCCAKYSPSGKRLLVSGIPESGTEYQPAPLQVVETESGQSTTIATDGLHASAALDGLQAYPGWIDDERVFYFAERSVYGVNGVSLSLMTVRADGAGRRCVQPVIDQFAIDSDVAEANPEPASR
jgi:Tol biopolymer transport system component